MKPKAKVEELEDPTNGAEYVFTGQTPYSVAVTIVGSSDFLFHGWNIESIKEKEDAPKNSDIKKTDNLESYVYRTPKGELAIPGEYMRMSVCNAAKYRPDPRSKRKSAMDLFKAGIMCMDELATVGKVNWDYVSRKHVKVNMSGITRFRPALVAGYRATFNLQVLLPEYIDREMLRSTIEAAGRLVGLGDFRPTFGRFGIVRFDDLA